MGPIFLWSGVFWLSEGLCRKVSESSVWGPLVPSSLLGFETPYVGKHRKLSVGLFGVASVSVGKVCLGPSCTLKPTRI